MELPLYQQGNDLFKLYMIMLSYSVFMLNVAFISTDYKYIYLLFVEIIKYLNHIRCHTSNTIIK